MASRGFLTHISGLWLLAAGLGIGCAEPATSEPERHVPVTDPAPLDIRRLSTFARPSSVVGQLIYVAVYPQIFHRKGGKLYTALGNTVSVHNINLDTSIYLTAVTYFGRKGNRLKEFISDAVVVGPLETKQFFIAPDDPQADTGANFIVKWEADAPANRPLVEGLVISTSAQQGISIITEGHVMKSLTSSTAGVP